MINTNIKKKLSVAVILLTSSLVLAGCTPSNDFYYAYERGDCYTHKFDDPRSELDLELEWKKDSLYMYWDQYEGDDFAGYYIIKSETKECPYYYIGLDDYEYVGKRTKTYYQDKGVTSEDIYYYRVCVKTEDREVHCGGVMKIEMY
jgi:hypothetical protein